MNTIDPYSLVRWATYTGSCYGSYYNPAITSPATCGRLSGELCTRPDVDCSSGTKFYDTNLLQNNQKVVALTAEPDTFTVSSVKPFDYTAFAG